MINRFDVFIGGLKLMNRAERWSAIGLATLMMVAGVLESAIVALVVPLVYVVVDPAAFNASRAGQFISSWTGRGVDQMFIVIAAGLALLLLFSAGVTWLAYYLSEVHGVRCRERVSRELLRRLFDAPYLWIMKHSSIVMLNHIHEEVRTWRRDFVQSILMSLQALIMIVSPAAVVIAIAPGDGLIALSLVAAICATVVFAFRRKLRTVATRSVAVQKSYLKQLLQTIAGVREIKVSGGGAYFETILNRDQSALDALVVQTRALANAPATIIMLLGQLGFIATGAFLWLRGLNGPNFAAQIALIAVVVSRVVPAFNRLASCVTTFFRAAPVVESLLSFMADLDRATSLSSKGRGKIDLPDNWRSISLIDVSFRYPGADRPSIQNVSIELERGKSYGFVGHSGAGKTTLVNLLLALIEPTQGVIQIDGRPLAEFRLQDWHRRFGYVPQDAFLLDQSLLENIRFGCDKYDDERLRAAVHAAQLGPFVDSQPNGLHSLVGERGREISGGQAQRVAIARALYRKAEILFLDEATSALDSVTEAAIFDAIEAASEERGCLALIVSHRVTSLRRCHCIFVLDEGRIVDAGTYEDLLARSELFVALAAQPNSLSITT